MAEPSTGLEALRGLHVGGAGLLADPAAWAAAAAGVLVAILLGALAARGPARRWALRREARDVLGQTRAMAPADAVSAQALLLRRIAMTVAGEAAACESGEAWLARLDAVFHTDFFTCGEGRCFGDALYLDAAPDRASLHRTLSKLIDRLHWPA